MTMKFTDGPWRVRPDGGDWRAVCEANGSSAYECVLAGDEVVALVVAQGSDVWESAPPTEYNARLIAASPDMLNALRKAVVFLAGACVHSPELQPHETYEAVSAAIAKAMGCAA